jgi:hypothetical protein
MYSSLQVCVHAKTSYINASKYELKQQPACNSKKKTTRSLAGKNPPHVQNQHQNAATKHVTTRSRN